MKRVVSILLAVALLPALCACAARQETPQDESSYMLWFPVRRASSRTDSAAMYREIRWQEKMPSAYELAETLLRGPEDEELYSPFPEGVAIRFLMTEGDTVWIDLSAAYGELSGFEMTLADYCLALTLCQLPEVESVKITVEGEVAHDRNRDTLREGDVLLSGIEEEPDTFLAALYFPDSGGRSLTVEYRQVVRTEQRDAVAVVMDELLRGPMEGEGRRALPEGTRVRSLSGRDRVCYVDLSEEFVNNAPASAEEAGLTLYALVNTLCVRSGVSQVQLLIESERISFYGTVSVSAPLSANFDLVSSS